MGKMKKKLDMTLFAWCSFVSIVFNLSMTRGCDTFGWSVVVMMITFLIFLIPFLPENLLNSILCYEVNYDE